MNTATKRKLALKDPSHLEYDPLAEIKKVTSLDLTNKSPRWVPMKLLDRDYSPFRNTSSISPQSTRSSWMDKWNTSILPPAASGSGDLLELENPITLEKISRISTRNLSLNGGKVIPASITSS